MDKKKQGFSKKTRIALTKFIKAAEKPEIYGIKHNNTAEQNQAVIKVLKTIFKFDGDNVVEFDDKFINQYYEITERPTIEIL